MGNSKAPVSIYFLEGLAAFVDQPGEWAYDAAEAAIAATLPAIQTGHTALPAGVFSVGVLAADAAFAVGALAYVLALPLGVAGAAYLLHARK